jgi:hypothetical protein
MGMLKFYCGFEENSGNSGVGLLRVGGAPATRRGLIPKSMTGTSFRTLGS